MRKVPAQNYIHTQFHQKTAKKGSKPRIVFAMKNLNSLNPDLSYLN